MLLLAAAVSGATAKSTAQPSVIWIDSGGPRNGTWLKGYFGDLGEFGHRQMRDGAEAGVP